MAALYEIKIMARDMSNNKTSNIFFMVCIGVGVLIDLTSKVKLLTLFPI